MNKRDAKEIAKTITNEQLAQMFDAAKNGIANWTKVSACNKGLSKGVAWNILAKNFDLEYNYHRIAKTNMVREFGDYLPEELKIAKVSKPKQEPPVHHDPEF